MWQELPRIALKGASILVRDCYEDLYSDIRDLTSPERGMRYIHISGNPGIGKSCFLWYVLERLFKEEETPAVIVELVRVMDVVTYVYQRDGDGDVSYEEVPSPRSSPCYKQAGVWLLTDQRFVGSHPPEGKTILFASPKKDNWVEAEKIMNEELFTVLYMPAWSVEELQAVYVRKGRTYTDFWKMYYVAGPVVRYYFKTLMEARARISSALEEVLDKGVIDATLLRGGRDKGQFSHQVFIFWPTLDFSIVDHISFVSEFAAEGFAIACFNGKVRDWMKSTVSLTTDRSLRGAAGVLFERYAHHRLARGGEFRCVDDPSKSLLMKKRDVKFFGGNDLNLQLPGLYYLRPSSASFPVIDSVYPPLIVFQMSLAMKRKAIKRSNYDALCASLLKFREQHPEVPTGLVGVETEQVYAVLVKMEGDKTNVSSRMTMVDDTPQVAAQASSSGRPKRLRAAREVTISRTREHKPATRVLKRRSLPFQMTIALNVEQADEMLEFPSIQEIHDTVSQRMVGRVDTGAVVFCDSKKQDVDAAFASVVMRQGRGSMLYEEKQYGAPAFVAWIEAVRSKATGEEFKVETALDISCTTGKLAGKDLTIFINERLGPDVICYPPLLLVMPGPGERASQAFDEPALREDVFENVAEEELSAEDAEYKREQTDYRHKHSGEHEFYWSGDKASVVIRSNAISSRKIKLVFPPDVSDESEDDFDEDYMQD